MFTQPDNYVTSTDHRPPCTMRLLHRGHVSLPCILSRWYVGNDKIMAAYCSGLKTPKKLYLHVCKVTEKPDSTPLRVCEEEKAVSWGRGFGRPPGGKDVSTDPPHPPSGRGLMAEKGILGLGRSIRWAHRKEATVGCTLELLKADWSQTEKASGQGVHYGSDSLVRAISLPRHGSTNSLPRSQAVPLLCISILYTGITHSLISSVVLRH